MPPSRHSSSHHSSSSSRSHSSHSSSHRSSSSSRSHSSHSSSHHSSSYSSSRGSSLFSSRSNHRSSYTPVRRTRTSQPYGWNDVEHGTVSHFHCSSHDYDYYPQSWTAGDGRHFEEGYYDENGRHYNNMIMAGGTTMLKCDYCGNRMVYQWQEGALPTCDKCGAQFQVDITDKQEPEAAYGGYSGGSTGGLSRTLKRILVLVGVIIALQVFGAILLMILGPGLMQRYEQDPVDPGKSVYSETNEIYVKEIGRTCVLDGTDWYDSTSDCWFYFYDGQWQYWYEGISSDYGDYGWMEYDMGEKAWYIEISDGNWVHLSGSYDTSRLWHMTDEYVNAYE